MIPDAERSCSWSYVAGRLHSDAAETSEAEAAFERAVGSGDGGVPCPLAPYAGLRAAEALLRMGRHDDAIRFLQQAGFQVQVNRYGPFDRVFDFSPVGQAPQGSTITLDVGY